MVGDRPLELPVVPLIRKPLPFWAPMVICEAAMVAIPPLSKVGQDGEVIVEGPAGTNALRPAADPGRMPAGDETNELVGVGTDVAAAPRGPALPGSTRHDACFCPSASSLVASHPRGYQASTLRTSPMTLSRTNSFAGEHDHREAGVGVGDDERDVVRGDGRVQAAGLVERGRQRLLAEHRDPRRPRRRRPVRKRSLGVTMVR